MTLKDYIDRGIPEYNDLMYLEGYTPEQILEAAHNTFIGELAGSDSIDAEPQVIKIISQVK